jgi:hypothetical protein
MRSQPSIPNVAGSRVHNLAKYIEPTGQSVRAVGAIPITLLIDRAGREVGRIIGPAEWDAPEVIEILKPVISKQSEMAASVGREAGPAQEHHGASSSLWRGLQWLNALFNE